VDRVVPQCDEKRLIAVLAQRLVRLICPSCKTPADADDAELWQLGDPGLGAAARAENG